jgi:TIR domain
MIFVSYSRKDEAWRKRFLVMAKPLERYQSIKFWSDRDIPAGMDWRAEIRQAMNDALVAVLLVSDNFLESEFIANEELPFFLDAAQKKKVAILWTLIAPCLWKKTRIKDIQACCVNEIEPLISMDEFGWKRNLCTLCERIDEIVLAAETPKINLALNGRSLERVQRNLQVLAEPAKTETEVLLYSGNGKWYTQSRIEKGSMTADCQIGDEKNTKPGDSFKLIALTRGRESQLKRASYHINVPPHRTKSPEVIVKRK